MSNRPGDGVAEDGWSRAKREDANVGAGGGSVFDRARLWFQTAPGVGDDEKRAAAKRMTSLYEYLSSADARRDPRHALRVARRMALREVVAARCWHSGATEFERKARPAILYRGVTWTKDTRKLVEGIDMRASGGAAKASRKTATGESDASATASAAATTTASPSKGRGGPGGAKTNG